MSWINIPARPRLDIEITHDQELLTSLREASENRAAPGDQGIPPVARRAEPSQPAFQAGAHGRAALLVAKSAATIARLACVRTPPGSGSDRTRLRPAGTLTDRPRGRNHSSARRPSATSAGRRRSAPIISLGRAADVAPLGERDALAELELLRPICARLGARATPHVILSGDHRFHVPKGSGRTDAEIQDDLAPAVATWTATLP